MKRAKRPFLKQKLTLYFDENFPSAVTSHFRSRSYWRKKVKILSAAEEGKLGQDDGSQFGFCSRNGYILVTRDSDFCDDKQYPFGFGQNPGIVIVRATRSEVHQIISSLSAFLDFVLQLPFPRSFVAEAKFILSGEGCIMRGRDGQTREIKSLYIEAGKTRMVEVRAHFSW
jgi:predicted nuclease of predicted toxin-antitoxin system